MKFHPNVLSTLFGVVSIEFASAQYEAFLNLCDANVVNQANTDGFFKYVMLNCMNGGSTTTNFLGSTTVVAEKCLSDWIANNDGDHPIPDIGDCRDAFQTLVSALNAQTHSQLTGCSYDSTADELTISNACGHQLINELWEFGHHAGVFIASPQCEAQTIQALAEVDIYSTIVTAAMAHSDDDTYTYDPVANIVDPAMDGGNGLCYACYHGFYYDLSNAVGHTALATICTDPKSSDCTKSTTMIANVLFFNKCSGGFDMLFKGPMCTLADVEEIQQLIPAPYFEFTHCAYDSTESFCSTTDAYLAKIEEDSNSSCVLCYTQYRKLVTADAAKAENIARCTGPEGVWAPGCVASQTHALNTFTSCSGYSLSTSNVASNTTTIAPAANDTTTASTTATTTVTPVVVPTTKAAATLLLTSLPAAALVFVTIANAL